MSLLYKILNIPRTQEEAIDKAKRNNKSVRFETDYNVYPDMGMGSSSFAFGLDTFESSAIVIVGNRRYTKRYSFKDVYPSRESTDALRNLAEERVKSLRRLI